VEHAHGSGRPGHRSDAALVVEPHRDDGGARRELARGCAAHAGAAGSGRVGNGPRPRAALPPIVSKSEFLFSLE